MFAAIVLSGCTTEEQQDNGKIYLSIKYTEGTALINQAVIEPVNQISDITKVIKTVTYPVKIYSDHADIKSVMVESFDLNKGLKIDTCGKVPKNNKESLFSVYLDGKIDSEGLARTNYFLPQKALDMNETWQFEGIIYKVAKLIGTENPKWPETTVKIEFSGIFRQRDVNGYFLFDTENGRFLKIEREELSLGQGVKLVTELTDANAGFDPESYNFECLAKQG